ncbi:MAG: GNAT family N-acetyltransferase [Flavobacteriaceae bacterium]
MQQPTLETPRLRIREMRLTDLDGMFALDSNPNVHRYLGNNPVKTKAEALEMIKSVLKQYETLGIGRWVMEEKESNLLVGWTGFKLNIEPLFGHSHFLDIGYRLREEFWGKGYAYESAVACMNYAVENLDFDIINAMAMTSNEASVNILQNKLGMRELGIFEGHGAPCYFFEITKAEWLARMFNV